MQAVGCARGSQNLFAMQLQRIIGRRWLKIRETNTSAIVPFVFLAPILHRPIYPCRGHNRDGIHIHCFAALVAAQVASDQVSAVSGEVSRDGTSTSDNALTDSRALLSTEASHTRNHISKDVTLTIEPATKGEKAVAPGTQTQYRSERVGNWQSCKQLVLHLRHLFTHAGVTTWSFQTLPAGMLPI